MKKSLITMLCAVCFSAVFADTITVATDSWLPYSGKAGSDKEGFMIEIAKEALKDSGHTVVYKNMPWNRAIEEGRKGKIQAIAGAYVSDAPDYVFPEEEGGVSVNKFFVKEESSWKYTGVDSLKTKVLGVIKGYSYGEVVDKYVAENAKNKKLIQQATGENAKEQNVKKLLKGRVDIFVEDGAVMAAFLASNPDLNKIKVAGKPNEGEKVYIAFSPKNPKSKSYAEALSKGIKAMRKDGRLEKILKKYGVQDWK